MFFLLISSHQGVMYSMSAYTLHKDIMYIINIFNTLAFTFIGPLDLQINLYIYYGNFSVMMVKYLVLKRSEYYSNFLTEKAKCLEEETSFTDLYKDTIEACSCLIFTVPNSVKKTVGC